MTKTDKAILTMALTLIVITTMFSLGQFIYNCGIVREETLRLHILADSNTDEDQRLKLVVRDAVLDEYSRIFANCADAEQSAQISEFLKDDIKKTATKALANEGHYEEVSVEVTNMYFDTKTYEEDITMPAGDYTALRITIGEAKGDNWWCVMYPPLCIPVASQSKAEEVHDKIESLSTQKAPEMKFAIVELIEKIKNVIDNDTLI